MNPEHVQPSLDVENVIQHWEVQLNNSLQAAHIARNALEKLYRMRHEQHISGILQES